MQNQSILYGVIGLLIGVLITIFVASNAVNTNNQGMMGMRMADDIISVQSKEIDMMKEWQKGWEY